MKKHAAGRLHILRLSYIKVLDPVTATILTTKELLYIIGL